MIENATLSNIADPAEPDLRGKQTYGAGTAMSVRCCQDEVKGLQRVALLSLVADSTALLYVPKRSLPSGVRLTRDQRVQVLLDGDAAAVAYVIRHAINREHGTQSHWECFLRVI